MKAKEAAEAQAAVMLRGCRPRTLRPFYLHQWLDVLDTDKKWLEAQVIGVNPDANTIRIHYKGWKSRYDEDLSMDDTTRIALLHTHTKPLNPVAPDVNLDVGAEVDALDTTDKWCKAVITHRDEEHQMVRVHYVNWNTKYDEWINMESYRLAPPGAHVPRTEPVVPVLRRRHTPACSFRVADDIETRFREQLRSSHGWYIVPMRNDGNCLFRSVAHQVYGDPELHALVRAKCVEYIACERAFFKDFISDRFEDYIERMKRDGEWGDHVEIQAMSELYNRPIVIYAYSLTPLKTYQGGHGASADRPIRLSYHMSSHYNSIYDPATHHEWILKCTPGEVEDKHIALARQGATKRAVAEDEDVELRLALEESRRQMQQGGMSDLERAIIASLQQSEADVLAASLEDPVQMALQASLLEAAARGSQPHCADADLQAAIAASLTESDAKTTVVTTLPLSDSKDSAAAAAAKRERVINRVVELGFNRAVVEAAWNKVNAGPIDAISEDTLTENVVTYLLR